MVISGSNSFGELTFLALITQSLTHGSSALASINTFSLSGYYCALPACTGADTGLSSWKCTYRLCVVWQFMLKARVCLCVCTHAGKAAAVGHSWTRAFQEPHSELHTRLDGGCGCL